MARVGLHYLRDGAEGTWLPGVPASDHNAEDAATAKARLASGLYERGALVPDPVEPSAAPEPEPETPRLAREPYFWLAPNERPEVTAEAADSAVAEAAAGAASPAAAATTEEAE